MKGNENENENEKKGNENEPTATMNSPDNPREVAVVPRSQDEHTRMKQLRTMLSYLGTLPILWLGVGLSSILGALHYHWALQQFVTVFVFAIWAFNNIDLPTFMKSFLLLLLEIFFKDIDIAGYPRIPSIGPAILCCAPHNNQFIDAVCVLKTAAMAGRQDVCFLVAEKSYNHPIFGRFIKAVGAIPVVRPQDLAKRGVGTVSLPERELIGDRSKYVVTGFDTKFKEQLSLKDSISITIPTSTSTSNSTSTSTSNSNSTSTAGESKESSNNLESTSRSSSEAATDSHLKSLELKVVDILSDDRIVVDAGEKVLNLKLPLNSATLHTDTFSYKCLPHVSHKRMFDSALRVLEDGGCIAIFPEGGSHDRSELLPLKHGVAHMALGALSRLEKNLSVDLVPSPNSQSFSPPSPFLFPNNNKMKGYRTAAHRERDTSTSSATNVLNIANISNTSSSPLKSQSYDASGPTRDRSFSSLESGSDILSIPVVPVGLNYFRPDRFRSRIFLDVGTPVNVNHEMIDCIKYDQGSSREESQEVAKALMEQITSGMKSVTVEAPTFQELLFIRFLRRLYIQKEATQQQRFAIMRVLAEGYKKHKNKEIVQKVKARFDQYSNLLRQLDIPDRAVQISSEQEHHDPQTALDSVIHHKARKKTFLVWRIIRFVVYSLIALPSCVVGSPILLAGWIVSEVKRKQALNSSSVKIHGIDVIATWKILIGMFMVPMVQVLYSLIALYLWGEPIAITVFFFLIPFLAAGVLSTEQVFPELRSLRTLISSIMYQQKSIELLALRKQLQSEFPEVISAIDCQNMLTREENPQLKSLVRQFPR